ncbi:MAG: RsmE family RNA methyltransferase [Planctomycetota bacterium]
MRTRTLFHPDLAAGRLTIADDEAHHARNVLRLRAGQSVRLVDGRGSAAEAAVVAVERHRVVCEARAPVAVPAPQASRLRVAVAAPKGARFDDTVRALTELGVGCIAPLRCERAQRVPDLARGRRIAREALKQCGRADLPGIGPVLDIETVAQAGTACIVLDREGLAPQPGAPQDTTMVIGPEGGLTAEECEYLRVAGARCVRLAQPVLRIETAAVAAAAVWAAEWERYG